MKNLLARFPSPPAGITRLALLLAAALLLIGCLVTSVYPFYDQKSLAFEPALLGDWETVKDSDEHWKFEQSEATNAFRITYSSGKNKSVMVGHTFKLDGNLFLDMLTAEISDENQPPPIPSHCLFRLPQVTPTLRMVPMNYEWLTKLLAENPKALRHHLIAEEKEDQRRLVLTADTSELQKFVLTHLQTEAAWPSDSDTEFKRTSTDKPR
jgi:hypothetical protein